MVLITFLLVSQNLMLKGFCSQCCVQRFFGHTSTISTVCLSWTEEPPPWFGSPIWKTFRNQSIYVGCKYTGFCFLFILKWMSEYQGFPLAVDLWRRNFGQNGQELHENQHFWGITVEGTWVDKPVFWVAGCDPPTYPTIQETLNIVSSSKFSFIQLININESHAEFDQSF